jgi:uridine kinase
MTAPAGPSGSGKSHFAKELLNFIPGSIALGMDNYMQREKVPPERAAAHVTLQLCDA